MLVVIFFFPLLCIFVAAAIAIMSLSRIHIPSGYLTKNNYN